jgi:ubiquinone/menaquinone biosynthesis C-methylase UbiE
MSGAEKAFVGSIPENYDRYMGPLKFEPYAVDLAARLPVRDGMRVLELACGTGRLTRRLRERLPADAHLTATDLNEPMIALAQTLVAGTGAAIDWQPADATSLPFADTAFDAVVCQFGLMFFPDKPAAVREARRVLVPGGRFLFSVWDALEHNELTQIAHEVILRLFPDDPPRFYDIPFGFHDPAAIRALLTDAGFGEVEITTVALTSTAPSAEDAARGLVEGTPMAGVLRARGPIVIAEVRDAVAAEIAVRCGAGPTRCTMQALVVSAVAI